VIFFWLRFAEEAFIRPTIKLEIEDEHATSKADRQLERACSGRLRLRKAEIDAMLARLQTLSEDHFGYAPGLGPCRHPRAYADLLKRITDMALNEGEHAA
jgi:hypothetical protein